MPYWLRNTLKIVGVLGGLLAIYLFLSQAIVAAKQTIQTQKSATVSSFVMSSYISEQPFGTSTNVVSPGKQYFYNMKVAKDDGVVCYITISWRWIMHTPAGSVVYWTESTGGETATGSKHDMDVAQAFQAPLNIVPGKYTLSRLSTYKCGNDDDYVKVIRTTELLVE